MTVKIAERMDDKIITKPSNVRIVRIPAQQIIAWAKGVPTFASGTST